MQLQSYIVCHKVSVTEEEEEEEEEEATNNSEVYGNKKCSFSVLFVLYFSKKKSLLKSQMLSHPALFILVKVEGLTLSIPIQPRSVNKADTIVSWILCFTKYTQVFDLVMFFIDHYAGRD